MKLKIQKYQMTFIAMRIGGYQYYKFTILNQILNTAQILWPNILPNQ